MPALLHSRRWILLVVISAGLFMITIDNSVLYTALPTLTRELGANATESLWIINAYPLVMAGLLLGAGTLGDRVGHRRMFVVGLAVFGTASAIAAFAPNPEVLIAARALLAIGAAAMMPSTLALIRLAFDDQRERNVALAAWGSIAVVGAAAGPIVGGVLIEAFWWGAVFLVNVPIVIAALVCIPVVAPAVRPDRSRPWDLVSSLLALVGLTGAVFALKELAKTGPDWVVAGVAVVLAAAAFALFVRRQRRLAYPLLDLGLFRNPVLMAGVLVASASMFAVAGVELATAQRFQAVEGFSPLQAGFVVAAVALGSLPSALLGGAVLHRVGPRILITGGLSVSAVGIVLAVVLLPVGWPGVVVGLVVAGAGIGFIWGSASSVILGGAPAHRAGMASSVEEVSYELGGLIAVATLGSVATAAYGPSSVGASAPTDGAYSVVLVAVAVVLVACTVVSAVLLRRARPTAAAEPELVGQH
ncbi:MFS transporter [Herbiconiux moechotypicola]|uniref:MFS transporter n=1 Tax=Herbiconiux moechotypicola TaxID=637393 RepID=A0ABP5QFY4_9MICO|nr:MFS transporter [Herbiconiux moechotypicola]MCS5729811.1 MFS transporter [Herbiconiux moechotypicola]